MPNEKLQTTPIKLNKTIKHINTTGGDIIAIMKNIYFVYEDLFQYVPYQKAYIYIFVCNKKWNTFSYFNWCNYFRHYHTDRNMLLKPTKWTPVEKQRGCLSAADKTVRRSVFAAGIGQLITRKPGFT